MQRKRRRPLDCARRERRCARRRALRDGLVCDEDEGRKEECRVEREVRGEGEVECGEDERACARAARVSEGLAELQGGQSKERDAPSRAELRASARNRLVKVVDERARVVATVKGWKRYLLSGARLRLSACVLAVRAEKRDERRTELRLLPDSSASRSGRQAQALDLAAERSGQVPMRRRGLRRSMRRS